MTRLHNAARRQDAARSLGEFPLFRCLPASHHPLVRYDNQSRRVAGRIYRDKKFSPGQVAGSRSSELMSDWLIKLFADRTHARTHCAHAFGESASNLRACYTLSAVGRGPADTLSWTTAMRYVSVMFGRCLTPSAGITMPRGAESTSCTVRSEETLVARLMNDETWVSIHAPPAKRVAY
jgi:hypothetical protein